MIPLKSDRLTGPESKKAGVLDLLSSMRLGLFLLITLGALSSLGSLIPQGRPGSFYKEVYGRLPGEVMVLAGLDQMYTSWWFISLGVLIAASITACSVKRLGKARGLKGHGSLMIHGSIIVILLGAFSSGLWGKSGYVEISAGDSLDLSAVGFNDLVLTVEDFKIDWYDNLEPKQYTSSITLAGKDGGVSSGKTSVNHPFKARGLKIYQHSYGWFTAGRVTAGDDGTPFALKSGEEIILDNKEGTRLKVIFIPHFDQAGGTLQTMSPLPENPRLVCALLKGNELVDVQVLSRGETGEVGGRGVSFEKFGYYTGLEVKKDPWTMVVFAGFAIMLSGFCLRYIAPETRGGRREEVS